MKQKFLLLMLLSIFVGSINSSLIAQNYSGGDGAEGSPFEIATLDDLRYLSEHSDGWDKHFILTADIDASETLGWNDGAGFSPIGNNVTKFTGNYNGGGHTISGLFINRPTVQYIGFFGRTDNAFIKNLGLINVLITGNHSSGIIAGSFDNGNISNCFSSGTITGYGFVGGLLGGSSSSTISNSYSMASATGGNQVGGLIGCSGKSVISNCYSTGNSGEGGLVGYASHGATTNSFWDTETSGKTTSAGGEGKTTAQMKDLLTYIAGTWDFKGLAVEEIWNIGNERNNGYPYLSWQFPGDAGPSYPIAPMISTNGITNATETSVTIEADIIFKGSEPATQHGVCWNTTGAPTTSDNKTELGAVVLAGAYSSNITGLTTSTTYYVRVYASNSAGTSYGEEIYFVLGNDPVGSGTEIDPYQIANLANLYWIMDNSAHWDKHFLQTANIDASETIGWDGGAGFSPIGNGGNKFTGSYHGGGHTISSLFINRIMAYKVGLFGHCENAFINNLGVINANIKGKKYVGSVVSYSTNDEIYNCFSSGTITGDESVGGLVGFTSNSTLSNNYSIASVEGRREVGGLVGEVNNSTISNCYSTGKIIDTSTLYTTVNGLIGSNSSFNSTSTNSFWDTETSEQNNSACNEIGKTTADMKELSTFINATWDFKGLGAEGIWNIGNERNNGYPYLSWQFPSDAGPSTAIAPVLITNGATNFEETSVTIEANITCIGNESAHQHGVCWNTTGAPTTSDNKTELGAVISGGVYTSILTELTIGTTYYAKAYTSNNLGTSYGNEIYFIAGIPPVGTGSETDPYLINNLANLNWIMINPDHWDKYYLQTADIDASVTIEWDGGAGFTPIGNFTGNYHGGGYTISGLFINRPSDDFIGLFGRSDNAFIKNLGLINANIKGNKYVGSVVGSSYNDEISNCFSSGEVTGKGDYAGGLVGMANGSIISNSYSRSIIAGVDYVAGLAGRLQGGALTNSYSTGTVTGSGFYVGGLIGYLYDATVTSSVWDTETSGQTYSSDVVAKTTAQMKHRATFTDVGWDFRGENDNIWNIGNARNNGYPYLNYQYPADPVIGSATVSTTIVSVGSVSAILGGEITDNASGKSVIQRGVCWSLLNEPTLSDNVTLDSLGAGVFNSTITGLSPLTTYFVKAYAINAQDTTYGEEQTFRTKKELLITGSFTANSKPYDGETTATINTNSLSITGAIPEYPSISLGSLTLAFDSKDVGTNKTISIIDAELVGDDISNYIINFSTAPQLTNGIITVKELTLTAENKEKVYGAADPVFTATYSGFATGDDETVLGGTLSFERVVGENVNDYALTPSGLTSTNYNINFVAGTLAITPKALSVEGSFTVNNREYDGTNTTTVAINSLTLRGIIGADIIGITPTVAFDNANAGTGKTVSLANASVLTGAKADNYTLSLTGAPTTTVNITAKALTVTADDYEKFYGSADPTYTATCSGFIFGEYEADLGGTLAFNREVGEDVSDYAITPSGLTSTNYNISYADGTLAITPKAISVEGSFTVNNREYNGTNTTTIATNSLTLSGVVAADIIGIIPTVAFENANAGTGKIVSLTSASVLTGAKAGNYTLSLSGAPITFASITAKALTVTAENKEKVYGTADPVFTATYSGFITGEDESVLGGMLALNREVGENVNNYAITPSGLTLTNYNINFVAGTFAITPKELSVEGSFTVENRDYDGTTTSTFSAYSLTLIGAVATDIVYITPTATFDNASAGTGKTVSLASTSVLAGSKAGNYTLSLTGAPTTTANITAKAFAVIAENKEKVYGTVDPAFTATYSGFIIGENESVLGGSLVFNRVAGDDVNNYAITPSGLTSTNYNISFGNGTLAITPKDITVTVDADQTKVYGQSDPILFTYTSSDASATFTGSLTRVAGVNVGDYAITKGTLVADNNWNIATFNSADFTITPKDITVTANADQTKVYGDIDPVFTYTSSDALATFTGLLDREAGEAVGDYAINKGTLVAGANWNIATFVSDNFAITPKDITVTANADQTKVYGDIDPVFTYTSNDASATFTGSMLRDAGDDVGNYAINKGTLVAGANWNIAIFNSADFSITPKEITVTANADQTKVYGDIDPVFTYTSSDALATFTGLLVRVAGESAGSYVISQGTLALAAGSNFEISTFNSADFTITPKNITVTVDADQTKVYGDIDPVFTYTSSDASATFTGSMLRDAGENIGDYAITKGTLVADANWNIATFVSDNFAITPKDITVTVNAGQAKVYGQSDPILFTYTSSDPLATFTGSLVGEAGDDIGEYEITQGTLVADNNWNIATFVSADFSITPKDITVTANAGQFKFFEESDPTSFTYTSSDLSATFIGSLNREAGEDIGDYAINQGTLVAGDNWNIADFVSADFSILTKYITVTVDAGQSKVYGESDPTSFTYTSSDPTATFTGSLKRVAGEIAGSYAITQGTLTANSNMVINVFNSANFTIFIKEVTVTVDAGQSKAYGQSDPTTFSYTSSDPTATFTGSLKRVAGENIGDYALNQGTLDGGSNWNITAFNSADFSITPKDITVTASAGQTKVYGQSDPTSFTYISSDPTATITGSMHRETGENVGDYAINQGTLAVGENWNIVTFNSVDFSITPNDITITANDQSKMIGTSDPDLTYQITAGSLLFGDEISGSLSRELGESVGEYAIEQGTISAGDNYNLNFVPGVFSIAAEAVQQYTLTIEVVGSGSVNVNGAAYTTAVIVDENSVLNLAAIAAEGYEFASWTGDVAEALEATTNITLNGNKTITATFTDITITQYALTIEIIGNGSVNVNGAAYTTAVIVDENSVLDLAVIAAEGYEFVSWTGDVAEALEATTNITMNGNKTITATFTDITIPQYALTIEVVGSGSVNVNGAVYTTAITVDQNSVLNLAAIAAEGYEFVSWTGNVAEAFEVTTTYSMPANDVTLTVSFEKKVPVSYTVTFTVSDKQQQAVEGATISIDGFGDKLVTNASGVATIELPDGTYNYTATTKGIQSVSSSIIVAGEDVFEDVSLINVGVDTEMLSNIELFPNPFSSSITFTNASRVSHVVITNLVGQTMMEIQFSGAEKETIATHDLVNGIYMIQIYGEKDEMIIRKMLNK